MFGFRHGTARLSSASSTWIDLAKKRSAADRAEKDAPGDWPGAVIGQDVPEATEGKSRTPRLGAGTAWKQTRHHPELEHRTYALAQNIPNEGELFGARAERRFVAFLGIDAKLWRAVFKIASHRGETFPVGLHKVKARDVAGARRDLTRLDRDAG